MGKKKNSSILDRTESSLENQIALDECQSSIALKCVRTVKKLLEINTEGCSTFPWKDCGIHRFYPNPEKDFWRTWTKKEINEGIPEDAIIGDRDKTYVGSIRGFDSCTDIPSMEKNRNLIVSCVNLLAETKKEFAK